MNGSSPTVCNLRWQDLLSSDEIRNWVNNQQVPQRLLTEITYAGVYRFVFPEARDGKYAHTPCYVGEAGKLGRRLLDHFPVKSDIKDDNKRTVTSKLRTGWKVRGSILNSLGNFKLQLLKIDGPVNFCGLTFGPDSIPSPFEYSFQRKMLENWAVLASEHIDHLHPLNCRGTPHVMRDILKEARRKASRRNSTFPQ